MPPRRGLAGTQAPGALARRRRRADPRPNTKTFGEALGAPSELLIGAYAVLAAVWVSAIAAAVVAVRRDAGAAPQPA